MELQNLPTASLRANDYNFNEFTDSQLKGLASEVRRRGFIMHHIVARLEGDGYVIIDGEHQWRAAQMAGLETVPVQVIEATPTDSIAETYRRNGLRGDTNRVKLGHAVRRMIAGQTDEEGKPLSLVKTGKMLGRSDKWVKTTLEYAELADIAAERQDFPQNVAKLTEEDVKSWLAFANGSGPNPNGDTLTLDGESSESAPAKDEPTDEEKSRKAIEGVVKKLSKMSAEDRAVIAAAIKRMDREAKKAATDKETAEPQLAV